MSHFIQWGYFQDSGAAYIKNCPQEHCDWWQLGDPERCTCLFLSPPPHTHTSIYKSLVLLNLVTYHSIELF